MAGGVYSITNTVNGHRYIGSSVNITQRISNHKNGLKHGYHHNAHLQNAFKKYGESAFVFTPILYCDPENNLLFEQMCIDGLNHEYNKSNIAEAPTRGIRLSQEHKEKLSAIKKGNTNRRGTKTTDVGRKNIATGTKKAMQSQECRDKLSAAKLGCAAWNKGIPMSNETRIKLMNSHLGRIVSVETRAKMSAGRKGENGSKSKLTWIQVGEIRNSYTSKKISQRKLAVEFQVSQHSIWNIINNITWRVE